MTGPENQGTREPAYSFRNLQLWEQAQAFARDVIAIVDDLPARRSVDSIARQLTRSATSIGANIAEGHGRFGLPSYRNHLSIAKGSACETDSWLDLLRRLGLLSPEREAELHRRCSSLIAAITRRILDLERTGKAAREERAGYVADEEIAESDGSLVPGFKGSEQ